MRNPNKRARAHSVVGQRGTPRPQTAVAMRAGFGYVIENHIREGGLQSATGVQSLYAWAYAAQPLAASALRGLRVRPVDDVAAGAAAPEHSPLGLAQSQVRELAAANQRKDEFLALLAHELRSPLCAISFAVGLLRVHNSEAGPQQPLQDLIERQVLRMTHLVDEVLDVSRVTHGLLNLRSERVDLRIVIANAVETLQSEIKGRTQSLNAQVPKLPVWVMGDERRLEQVFVNLIGNASRYTDTGGKLTILMYADGGEVVIRIRDSGIGISAEALPGIFELFRQADAADPRSKVGLGVGLALVRQLVELHGGKVSAASEGIGRGSVFTITLPALADWLPVPMPTDAHDVGPECSGYELTVPR